MRCCKEMFQLFMNKLHDNRLHGDAVYITLEAIDISLLPQESHIIICGFLENRLIIGNAATISPTTSCDLFLLHCIRNSLHKESYLKFELCRQLDVVLQKETNRRKVSFAKLRLYRHTFRSTPLHCVLRIWFLLR